MFDRIATRYDLLNSVISFGLDRRWRQKVVQELGFNGRQLILDLGTGTGDLAFSAAQTSRGKEQIIGLDASFNMLRLARAKQQAARNGYRIHFVQGSALLAPFKGSVFDAAMTAFVLRNISDLSGFFADGFRLLKPGGKMVSLDMFPPPKSWFSPLYAIYFYQVVPSIGAILARDRKAYEYLAESVQRFLPPEAVTELIEKAGFRHEGRMRKVLNKEGRGWDMLYMGILREEWMEQNA